MIYLHDKQGIDRRDWRKDDLLEGNSEVCMCVCNKMSYFVDYNHNGVKCGKKILNYEQIIKISRNLALEVSLKTETIFFYSNFTKIQYQS